MYMTENKDIQPQQQASASYAHDREQRHTATTIRHLLVMHMTENKDIQPQQQASASYAHDREQRYTATTTGIC